MNETSLQTTVFRISPYAHGTACDESDSAIEIVYFLFRANDGM
jgi:hypothetical protein